MKTAATLFVLMFVNYLLNSISVLFLVRHSYVGVAVIDFSIAFWGFTMTRLVAHANSRTDQVAFALGGVCGSLLGMYLVGGH